LFGFVGVLLALPVAAVLLVAGRHLRRQFAAGSVLDSESSRR
jgi:predicted PurR-regulated permease PerM